MRRHNDTMASEYEQKFALAAHKPANKESRASRGDWYSTKDNKISGELENVSKGVSPYEYSSNGSISVRDAIILCQKAYWNVAIFRLTIDIQTEFANSKMHFRSKNKRVAKFFEKWYEKIGGWHLAERFFREWFRSGNLFIYKFNGVLNLTEYRKFTRAAIGEDKIPLRYIILNPADISCLGGSSFVNAEYGKLLSKYEVERLKNPTTDDEQEFFDSLDEKAKKAIKSGSQPLIKLKQEDLTAVFCGKQDYEAMAIPMYYAVLPDIDLKLEFKKAEKVLARTIDYAVLLVTAGEKNGGNKNLQILQDITELFSAESVGRVIVADYTTKMEWGLPKLNDILGPSKYEVVNQDISDGMLSIFTGAGEKFSSTFIKTQVFLERLNQAREAYVNSFLKPEMEKIAKTFSFETVPEIEFEAVNLRNDVEMEKLYVRMYELGLLSPDQAFEAFQTSQLPLPEESLVGQQEFKKLKDKSLYAPILGGPKEEGRPAGSRAPQSTKKTTPVGGSVDEAQFSLSKISENLKDFQAFVERVEEGYKAKNSILRLSKKNKQLCSIIAENIAMNEKKSSWHSNIDNYLVNPNYKGDSSCYDDVLTIAATHNISNRLAIILNNSIIPDEN